MKPEDLSIDELKELIRRKEKSDDKKENPKEAKGVVVDRDFVVQRDDKSGVSKKQPVKGGKNTWTDKGEHRDVDTPNYEPSTRSRPATHKVNKVCHVCGKKFEIVASLVSGEFMRCNSCIG
jgi:hypothetical protein